MSACSFVTCFLDIAAREPDRLFARFEGQDLTFGRLHAGASAFAAHMQANGASPGDRVAVMMDNGFAAICTIFGLAFAGMAWVPVNPRLVGQSLAYQLGHSEPKLLVCDEKHLAAVQASGHDPASSAVIIHSPQGELAGILDSAKSFDASVRTGKDLFALMYTSGTTGPPKGVMITHCMMSFAGEGVRHGSCAQAGDVMFLWEPLCHIGGAQMLILPLLVEVHLAMVPRFSASRFWAEVAETGATHIHYLGGILQMLLKQPPAQGDKIHGVRAAWGGGCPAETWVQFEERFAIPIRECYGMSEASSLTSSNVTGVVGSVGQPMDWLAVTIASPDEAGRGEILVRERQPGALFAGYFNNPDATAKALQNGSLHTGDLGSMDSEGNLYFHGRINDSIRVKGELVSAWEVESVATSHPDIEECAAIGVEADVGEQEIKLFVKVQRGAHLSMVALADWLQSRLAPHQQPASYALVDDFPRTPSQRIIKAQLR
ncbi:MAG: ATP-dependent acyl-CoA ligase [Alphaproteobacteria bacterium]|nr:ATP-dependent acyl-CoA ligase [Alphaproteobacteria bacterium]